MTDRISWMARVCRLVVRGISRTNPQSPSLAAIASAGVPATGDLKRFRFLWWWRSFFVFLLLCMGAVTTAQDLAKPVPQLEKKHLLVVHAGRHDLPETR